MFPGRRPILGLLIVPLLVILGYFAFSLAQKHRAIHAHNKCIMTFMWRRPILTPIPVPDYEDGRYSLLQYSEAFTFPTDYIGGPTEIPVIFVPGSGGSGAQVRSLASLMQNKTEMRRAPFRFHFYALDFKEEMSFLSGNTLIRQRDFLIKVVKVLKARYPKTAEKMIFFGHSFGGVVIRSLPLHPDFEPKYMNLVLTLAAPLLHFPIVLDFPMANFYTQIVELWEIAEEKKLDHVKFISFSGGEKDFLVPDRLVSADNTVHYPSWSVTDVETPTDHLCILWCNQLVRHISRIIYSYGNKALSKANPALTFQVLSEYESKEKGRIDVLKKIIDQSGAKESEVAISSIGTFGSDSSPQKAAFRVDLPTEQVQRIYVQCTDGRGFSCSEKFNATMLYPNDWTSYGEDSHLNGIRVKLILLRPHSNSHPAYLVFEAPEGNVDYSITAETDFMASWYMVAINYAFDILAAVYFLIFLAVFLVESAGISVTFISTISLITSFIGAVLLIFHPYVFASSIVGILLLVGEYQPVLSFTIDKLNSRYLCLILAILHPDLTVISTILRNPKTRTSQILQVFLALSAATILPSLFEGAKPRLALPFHFYCVIKDVTIFNPSWLFFAAEFVGKRDFIKREGYWTMILAMVTSYNILFLLLGSQVFEQSPLSFFPQLFCHILLLVRFYPKLATWARVFY